MVAPGIIREWIVTQKTFGPAWHRRLFYRLSAVVWVVLRWLKIPVRPPSRSPSIIDCKSYVAPTGINVVNPGESILVILGNGEHVYLINGQIHRPMIFDVTRPERKKRPWSKKSNAKT